MVQGSSCRGPRFRNKAIREKHGRLGGSSRSLVSGVGKRSFSFRGEFRVDDEVFQVSGFQPDVISFDKRFETSSGMGRHNLSG